MNTTKPTVSVFELNGIPNFFQALPLALQHVVAMIVGSSLPMIIGGVIAVIVGMAMKKIRRFFPPLIAGTVVFTIGLSLYPTAINYMAGGYG